MKSRRTSTSHTIGVGAMLLVVTCLIVPMLGRGDHRDRATVGTGYDLSWHTVDGGPGAPGFSSGGNLELYATVAQPDAGVMTGGDIELVGGFWPGIPSDECEFVSADRAQSSPRSARAPHTDPPVAGSRYRLQAAPGVRTMARLRSVDGGIFTVARRTVESRLIPEFFEHKTGPQFAPSSANHDPDRRHLWGVPTGDHALNARGESQLTHDSAVRDTLRRDLPQGSDAWQATPASILRSQVTRPKAFRLWNDASISLTYPNGGETCVAGESAYVSWVAAGLPGELPIIVAIRNGPNGPGALLLDEGGPDSIVSDGRTTFDVPNWLGDHGGYVVDLWVISSWLFEFTISDQSDGPFTIVGSDSLSALEITVPVEGTSWAAGTQENFTWSALAAYPNSVFLLEESTELAFMDGTLISDNTVSWNIPANIGNGMRYRVFLIGATEAGSSRWWPFDISPFFQIYGSDPRPTLTITTPNGGEQWETGATKDICWSSSEVTYGPALMLTKAGFEQLQLYRGFGPMANGLEGCTSYAVCPFLPNGDDYRLEGDYLADNFLHITDESDAHFEVVGSEATIPSDFDRDDDVDSADAGTLLGCLTGPGMPLNEPCQVVDVDADGDADLLEFAVLQRCFSGPAVSPDAACVGLPPPDISGMWLLHKTPNGEMNARTYCTYIDAGLSTRDGYYLDWEKDYSISVDVARMGGGICLSGRGQLYGTDVFYDAAATVDVNGMAGTYHYRGAEEESGTWSAVRTTCKTAKGWVRVVSINNCEYALDFYLWDLIPDGVPISACTLTGPHVGTIDLTGGPTEFDPWRGQMWLGATEPTPGSTYTFTVEYADGQAESASAKVRPTLVDAPVPVSPSDCEVVSTLTPTLSWTAPPCGCQGYYRIWVVDDTYATVWSVYPSKETTSVVYNFDGYGAPLEHGRVYEWRLIAFDEPTSGTPDNNITVTTKFAVQP